MSKVEPESVPKLKDKICWQNVAACCTMPIEGKIVKMAFVI